MNYPKVLGEFETVDLLLEGYSLGRYGDGELKVLHGAGYSREPANPALTDELRAAFLTPHARCLVGVPTMDPAGPKYENWTRHAGRFAGVMVEGQRYVSAFVSRPDSAPWINSLGYAKQVEHLWARRRAVVVCEKKGSMIKAVRCGAREAIHVACPRHGAYSYIDKLEARVLAHAPDIVILSAGPTASCLANRLARAGVQAVDLGSAGGFLLKLLEGGR